jgi:hypothetical protein
MENAFDCSFDETFSPRPSFKVYDRFSFILPVREAIILSYITDKNLLDPDPDGAILNEKKLGERLGIDKRKIRNTLKSLKKKDFIEFGKSDNPDSQWVRLNWKNIHLTFYNEEMDRREEEWLRLLNE